MLKIRTQLSSPLAATLLFVGFPWHATAAEYNTTIAGVINEVTAIVNPAADYAGPPPEVTPAFAARFAVGQSVATKFTFKDGVVDTILAVDWGRYPLDGDQVGSVVVDGEQYQLRAGVISAFTGGTDRYVFSSFTSQEISNPVSATGVLLGIAIEGRNLLNSDALVPPPPTWESASGDLFFNSGFFWQGIRFSVDEVVVNAVPEPSTLAIAIAFFGVGCCRRPRRFSR